jgi:hypothetical protein
MLAPCCSEYYREVFRVLNDQYLIYVSGLIHNHTTCFRRNHINAYRS